MKRPLDNGIDFLYISININSVAGKKMSDVRRRVDELKNEHTNE